MGDDNKLCCEIFLSQERAFSYTKSCSDFLSGTNFIFDLFLLCQSHFRETISDSNIFLNQFYNR